MIAWRERWDDDIDLGGTRTQLAVGASRLRADADLRLRGHSDGGRACLLARPRIDELVRGTLAPAPCRSSAASGRKPLRRLSTLAATAPNGPAAHLRLLDLRCGGFRCR